MADIAWERAHREGRRVFWEPNTDTLRSCPENYCLAYWVRDRGWFAYRDEEATRAIHNVMDGELAMKRMMPGNIACGVLSAVLLCNFPIRNQKGD